jgi:hypothetical protein
MEWLWNGCDNGGDNGGEMATYGTVKIMAVGLKIF